MADMQAELSDDDHAFRIFELKFDGIKATDIQNELGLRPKVFAAIDRRIRRTHNKLVRKYDNDETK